MRASPAEYNSALRDADCKSALRDAEYKAALRFPLCFPSPFLPADCKSALRRGRASLLGGLRA